MEAGWLLIWWIWLIFVPLHDSCWVWYWAITEYFYLKCYQCFFVVMMLGDTPDRGGGGSVSDCKISVEISSCRAIILIPSQWINRPNWRYNLWIILNTNKFAHNPNWLKPSNEIQGGWFIANFERFLRIIDQQINNNK